MKMNPLEYPNPSRRSVTYGREGICASGNPYATQAGIDILKSGGNAVDAAIAMAMAHVVVEPCCNGFGSDAFAILSIEGELYGLNASGPAPMALTANFLRDHGYEDIPERGPLTIDIPGAVAGWIALHERFGRLSLEEVAAPAIELARDGYVVTPIISKIWASEVNHLDRYREDPAFKGFFDTFTIDGRAPKAGEVKYLPHHTETLESIVKTRGESFYRGELAHKIADYVQSHGGVLSYEDLANYEVEWCDPISVNYGGYDVWEMPPNGHGMTVLMALEIYQGLDKKGLTEEEKTHCAIEALKHAYVDTREYVAERTRMRPSMESLLSKAYLTGRCGCISDEATDPKIGTPEENSTIYLATADGEGNMVSFIQSNYQEFGSGVVVEGTGIALSNRVRNFRMDMEHPNGLVGGTRPYHTIIPGFLTRDGKPVGPFGVMGGFMQPQGQFQVLLNMIDKNFNPQAALDAPRWQWFEHKKLGIEAAYDPTIVGHLKSCGHEVEIFHDTMSMGRGQIILRQDNGVYIGGTEPRTDGCIIGY